MDYSIGDTIEYLTFGCELRQVVVQVKEENIKNGRPGFDGVQLGFGNHCGTVWGYDSQITRIVRKAVQS